MVMAGMRRGFLTSHEASCSGGCVAAPTFLVLRMTKVTTSAPEPLHYLKQHLAKQRVLKRSLWNLHLPF